MKDFLRYLTLLGIGVVIYLLLIPATMEQRGGFYIGGEVMAIFMPLALDYGIRDLLGIPSVKSRKA